MPLQPLEMLNHLPLHPHLHYHHSQLGLGSLLFVPPQGLLPLLEVSLKAEAGNSKVQAGRLWAGCSKVEAGQVGISLKV